MGSRVTFKARIDRRTESHNNGPNTALHNYIFRVDWLCELGATGTLAGAGAFPLLLLLFTATLQLVIGSKYHEETFVVSRITVFVAMLDESQFVVEKLKISRRNTKIPTLSQAPQRFN